MHGALQHAVRVLRKEDFHVVRNHVLDTHFFATHVLDTHAVDDHRADADSRHSVVLSAQHVPDGQEAGVGEGNVERDPVAGVEAEQDEDQAQEAQGAPGIRNVLAGTVPAATALR